MNTTAVKYSAEPRSRRCSLESILSIQDKETDFVCDSSDTEPYTDYGQDVEYEPCTEPEDDAPSLGDSSGDSDNEIIATKVIEVSVRDDGDMVFADSEPGSDGFDSEVDLCDYWQCAQCGNHNNNPIYRYCERCFKVRKNFFPPRPKPKYRQRRKLLELEDSRPLSQDSDNDNHRKVPLDLPQGTGNQEKHRLPLTPESDSEEKVQFPSLSQEIFLDKDRLAPCSQEKDILEKECLASSSRESETLVKDWLDVLCQEKDNSEKDRLALLSQENDSKEKYNLPTLSQGNSQDIVHTLSKEVEKDQMRSMSQDSGFDSQELSEPTSTTSVLTQESIATSLTQVINEVDIKTVIDEVRLIRQDSIERTLKRRAESADRKSKRIRVENSSGNDSDSDTKVSPLVKTVSDPSLTVEDVRITKRMMSETAKELDKDNNMCIVCLSEPKSGIFVHGRVAHICCCYKCAVKVWAKAKRCPVCNCKVSNVLKAVVM